MSRLRYVGSLSDTRALLAFCRGLAGIGRLHVYEVKERLLAKYRSGLRTESLQPNVRNAKLPASELAALIDGTWDETLLHRVELSTNGAELTIRGRYEGTLNACLQRNGTDAFTLVIEGDPGEVAAAAFAVDSEDGKELWCDESGGSGAAVALAAWRVAHAGQRA
ncbi:MAG: hypothetical protein U0136_12975 [Bdellovibrionota bacterium]